MGFLIFILYMMYEGVSRGPYVCTCGPVVVLVIVLVLVLVLFDLGLFWGVFEESAVQKCTDTLGVCPDPWSV